FHLFVKLHNDSPEKVDYSQLINRNELSISNLKLPIADSIIKKTGLIKIYNHTYYQVSTGKKEIKYYDTKSGTELADGDKTFATFLSNYYRPETKGMKQVKGKLKVAQIRQFDNEYGFINKRLP